VSAVVIYGIYPYLNPKVSGSIEVGFQEKRWGGKGTGKVQDGICPGK